MPRIGPGEGVPGGDYGFRPGKSLALGMVRPELGEASTELSMGILGAWHRVTAILESPYDPENLRLRS